MKVQQGYSYHIKDDFFNLVKDKYLMSNKEGENYRPHFYAVQDKKNEELYWMIPISSQAEKYKGIIEKKKEKYGKCNTIVIGKFAGKENAFLIQNAFPIIEKYLDHIHTIQGQPIIVHNELNKTLIKNLQDVLAMYDSGVKLVFPNVREIKNTMEQELKNDQGKQKLQHGQCFWDLSKIYREEDLFPKEITTWEQRNYGFLFYNEENKDSFDSNHAIIFREKISDLKQVLNDITVFYKKKGIKPSIYQSICEEGYFAEIQKELLSCGFECWTEEQKYMGMSPVIIFISAKWKYYHFEKGGVNITKNITTEKIK